MRRCLPVVAITFLAMGGPASALDFDIDVNPFVEMGTIDNEEDNHQASTAHKFVSRIWR